jgi:hypothetical protein
MMASRARSGIAPRNQVSKSGVQCLSARSFRHRGVGTDRAKAECRHLASSAVEALSSYQDPKIHSWLSQQADLCTISTAEFKHFMPGCAGWVANP